MSRREFDYDAEVAKLAEVTDRPEVEVRAEIEGLMQTYDVPIQGAVAMWKSENRFRMSVERQTWIARLLCKELPHTANTPRGPSMVQNLHFVVRDPETGEPIFKTAPLWGADRIDELAPLFENGKAYSLDASLNRDEALIRIGNVEEIDDVLAPKIWEIEPKPIDELKDVLGQYEFVRGWVGRLITAQGSPDPIGFEVGDIGSLLPLTVWFAGQYSRIQPEDAQEIKTGLARGREVAVYGFVAGTGADVRMNASAVFFAEG